MILGSVLCGAGRSWTAATPRPTRRCGHGHDSEALRRRLTGVVVALDPSRTSGPARCSWSSGVEGAVLAEAEIVAPGVDHVEGALAPGAVEHFAGRFAVHLVGRQHAET
jgi:hypothetical protein